MVNAICQEIALQKSYLRTNPNELIALKTVYFGGGTPSLLSKEELKLIFDTIEKHFILLPDAEVTLEANPDDLNLQNLALFKQFPINRLSIGIQSFHEPHLVYLHRAHSAHEAENSVKLAQQVGFDNISIDLIYAIPAADHAIWQADLEKAIALNVQHISSYCLTIEPQTAFGKWLHKGKIKAVEEDFAAHQFEMLLAHLHARGFEQYEISNFALPGYYSRHNSNYWKKHSYLGVGPSAHSYNGYSRQYNVSNNAAYLKVVAQEKIPFTSEELSVNDQINEYLMTSLRTCWGFDTKEVKNIYKVDMLLLHNDYLVNCQQRGLLRIENGVIVLTTQGKLLADQITADLFIM